LAKIYQKKLTTNLNIIISNTKFTKLLEALSYHLINEGQYLLCMISECPEEFGEKIFDCSFLVFPTDQLRNQKFAKGSNMVWLIHSNIEEGSEYVSEGGFAFDIKTCKKSYDEMNEKINFKEVETIKDVPIFGAVIEFNEKELNNHCIAILTNTNKCIFSYNNDNIIL
jgi:hypothetical protein